MTIKSWTPDQYRALGLTAPNRDGPWALEANPHTNYRTSRRGHKILGVGVHITAGLSDFDPPDHSAEATAKYGATTSREASWAVCIDSDSIIPCVRDAYAAWTQGVKGRPGYNDAMLGVEIGLRHPDWGRPPAWWVTATLTRFAVWVAPRVIRHGIPLTVIRDRAAVDRAIAAGRPFGFVAHHVLDPTRRADPGLYRGRDTFPWAQFFALTRTEMKRLQGAPTDWSDMATKDEIKAAVREVLAEPATARAILTGHRIMVDPTNPEGERVAPSRVIELGATAAVQAAAKTGVDVTAIKAAVAKAVDDLDIKVVPQ